MEARNDHLIKLRVAGLMRNQNQTGYFALVLEEISGNRRIQIVIGNNEAQSIECALRNVQAPRPMTHDLMYQIMRICKITLHGVVIDMLPDGIFCGKMMITYGDEGSEMVLDARSSDAVALAVRAKAPIYIDPALIEQIGITMSETDNENIFIDAEKIPGINDHHRTSHQNQHRDIKEFSIKELKDRLKEAIETEQYEQASLIKEEITRRNSDNTSKES